MYFHSTTGDKGEFPPTFPPGEAAGSDCLQIATGPQWQRSPWGLVAEVRWCSLSPSLSMILWCSFLFRIPHFETPTRNQNWNLCLCKFIQTFSNFRQSWPKTCSGIHADLTNPDPEITTKCVISSGSMLNGHPSSPLRQPSLLWPISLSLVQWRSFSWRCNFCISLSSFQSLGGSTSFFSPIGLYSWRL